MSRRVGLWLIGARGGVAAVAIGGLAALQRGLSDTCGLVTSLPALASLELVDWPDIVVGGHEIRSGCLADELRKFQESSRVLSDSLLEQIEPQLREVDTAIRPGIMFRSGATIDALADAAISTDDRTPAQKIEQLRSDLDEFRQAHELQHVVVINLASTERPPDASSIPQSWNELEPTLNDNDCPLPTSSLYAIAAMRSGCSFVNFTPSTVTTPTRVNCPEEGRFSRTLTSPS